jgi:hypothetical protein
MASNTEYNKKKVKWSRYRPGVAQRVGRGIALFFHDRGTRRGWVVSSTPGPHLTPGKDPVPILQGAGWAPGPVWTGGKSRPDRDSIPDRPACSQSLYRLYTEHNMRRYYVNKCLQIGVQPNSHRSYLPNNISDQFNSKYNFISQTYKMFKSESTYSFCTVMKWNGEHALMNMAA